MLGISDEISTSRHRQGAVISRTGSTLASVSDSTTSFQKEAPPPLENYSPGYAPYSRSEAYKSRMVSQSAPPYGRSELPDNAWLFCFRGGPDSENLLPWISDLAACCTLLIKVSLLPRPPQLLESTASVDPRNLKGLPSSMPGHDR
jgi:hypothetical protein